MKEIFNVSNEVEAVKEEWSEDPREPGPWHVVTIGMHASHFSALEREAIQVAVWSYLNTLARSKFPPTVARAICSHCQRDVFINDLRRAACECGAEWSR